MAASVGSCLDSFTRPFSHGRALTVLSAIKLYASATATAAAVGYFIMPAIELACTQIRTLILATAKSILLAVGRG